MSKPPERLPEPYRTGVVMRIVWFSRHDPEYYREVMTLCWSRIAHGGWLPYTPEHTHWFFAPDCFPRPPTEAEIAAIAADMPKADRR